MVHYYYILCISFAQNLIFFSARPFAVVGYHEELYHFCHRRRWCLRPSLELTCIDGTWTQLFFNSQELIVFGESLRSTRGSSFDLSGAKTYHQVRDEGVLRLSGSVGHHHAPTSLHGHVASLSRGKKGRDNQKNQSQTFAFFDGSNIWNKNDSRLNTKIDLNRLSNGSDLVDFE